MTGTAPALAPPTLSIIIPLYREGVRIHDKLLTLDCAVKAWQQCTPRTSQDRRHNLFHRLRHQHYALKEYTGHWLGVVRPKLA